MSASDFWVSFQENLSKGFQPVETPRPPPDACEAFMMVIWAEGSAEHGVDTPTAPTHDFFLADTNPESYAEASH